MMHHVRCGKRMAVSLLLALALLSAGALTALAEEAVTPVSAVDRAQVSGVLAGSRAGSFDYYQVGYAGGGEALYIELTFFPRDPSFASGIGFSVYGPSGAIGSGSWVQADGVTRFSYSGDDALTLLIQVFNYTDITVAYDLAAIGAATVPAAVVQEAAVEAAAVTDETPAEAVEGAVAEAPDDGMGLDFVTTVIETLADRVEGRLLGNRAGAYTTYVLPYGGDQAEVTLTLDVWPADPSFVKAFGFDVYGPSGWVASGVQTSVHGQFRAAFASDEAGDYWVQLHNYADGVFMHYSLAVSD